VERATPQPAHRAGNEEQTAQRQRRVKAEAALRAVAGSSAAMARISSIPGVTPNRWRQVIRRRRDQRLDRRPDIGGKTRDSSPGSSGVMRDVVSPDYNEHSARVQADHYREIAARFRLMADIEPLASVRRHLRWLAAQHDELATQPFAGRRRASALR
jgi:hypothetical protein